MEEHLLIAKSSAFSGFDMSKRTDVLGRVT